MNVIPRDTIISTLSSALEPLPYVHAAWLGGSAASGRSDEWSDIDLQVVVDDDRIEDAYDAVHRALESLSPIRHRHRMPTPTWHGHEQELVALRDADPCHFLDLVLIARSSRSWFLEPERHGAAVVLFDKAELVKPAPFDRDAHCEKMAARLEVLRTTFPLLQNLVTKAVRRGAAADAVQSYLSFTLRPLVELLRMRHAPDMYDFGLRYLDRDLPDALRAEIERLALPPAVDDVETFRQRAEALFQATLRAHDDGTWRIR